jgi:predicted glycosyltransferase
MSKQNPEYHIQAAFVREMELRQPRIMVFSDTAAHIGKTMFQQMRANKLQSTISKAWPDVFVAQPTPQYAGLFLEFKSETPYLKDGKTLKKNDHIRDQEACMQRLRERGYAARFVWSKEQAIEVFYRYIETGEY